MMEPTAKSRPLFQDIYTGLDRLQSAMEHAAMKEYSSRRASPNHFQPPASVRIFSVINSLRDALDALNDHEKDAVENFLTDH